MDFLRDLIDIESDHVPIMEALNSLDLIEENSRGGKVVPRAIKGAKAFFNANPAMVIGAAAMAVGAYTQYKRNKRNTITLHAKDAYERRMMTSVVDALTKGNAFRVVRTKFQGGGKSWQLKRVGASV